jgi:hypothetical protein
MPTKIIVFDPLSEDELQTTEVELDTLFNSGWGIVTTVSGNRTGTVISESYSAPLSSAPIMPTFKDYVVIILYKSSTEP